MEKETLCLYGFVMTTPKESFKLSQWVEQFKGWLRERKRSNPERELPNMMVLVCEGKETVRLVHLLLHWRDDEEKHQVAQAVTSFASTSVGGYFQWQLQVPSQPPR